MPVEKTLIVEEKEFWYIVLITQVNLNLNKSGWIRQLKGMKRRLYHKNVNNRSSIE